MHRFWDSVLEKIFKIIKPLHIVEIGADYGYNTLKIIRYCEESGGMLHCVDPHPKFDTDALSSRYGKHFIFYNTLSLTALCRIKTCDAVLIDGDHNWYTVYNELKLIEKACLEQQSEFPLMFFHDMGWPYARRDLYYAPENIPSEFRQAYTKKGIDPATSKLTDVGGLNPHLNNALYEGNAKNGVRTAVEDFIKETDFHLELFFLPGFYGLGILVPADLLGQDPELKAFLEDLIPKSRCREFIDVLERSRIDRELAVKEAIVKASKNQEALKHKQQNIQNLQDWSETVCTQVSALLSSRRWRMGNRLGEVIRKITFRPKVVTAADFLKNNITEYRKMQKIPK